MFGYTAPKIKCIIAYPKRVSVGSIFKENKVLLKAQCGTFRHEMKQRIVNVLCKSHLLVLHFYYEAIILR